MVKYIFLIIMLFISSIKGANRLRYGLQIGILYFVIFVASASVVVNFEKFLRWNVEGIRVVNVDATFHNKSALQCALLCTNFSGECVSFNRHISGTCELNTKPFDFYTTYLSRETSWSLYERGDCGLGHINGKHCIMVPRGGGSIGWSGARQLCIGGRADLVKIADDSEMQAINQEMNRVFPNLPDWVGILWIGLSKAQTQEFVWTDMSLLGYSNYKYGEPKTGNDCAGITNYQSSWVWKTLNCSKSWSLICERRNILA